MSSDDLHAGALAVRLGLQAIELRKLATEIADLRLRIRDFWDSQDNYSHVDIAVWCQETLDQSEKRIEETITREDQENVALTAERERLVAQVAALIIGLQAVAFGPHDFVFVREGLDRMHSATCRTCRANAVLAGNGKPTDG